MGVRGEGGLLGVSKSAECIVEAERIGVALPPSGGRTFLVARKKKEKIGKKK